MDSHSFCRDLLKTAISDIKRLQPNFKPSSLTVTKSSIGGYEVEGEDRFYHNANSACCVWSAKAEAIDYMIESGERTK